MNENVFINPYCIELVEGFTPQVSYLIKMMNYARKTTLQSIEGLSIEQLDFQFSETSNSIGALLAHISAVEECFQVGIFENRAMTDEEFLPLKPAFELGELGRENIKGNPLGFYVDRLNITRKNTLKNFSMVDDEWLLKPFYNSRNTKGNNYFEWFHVFEDEINHRGQIRLISKMQGIKSKYF